MARHPRVCAAGLLYHVIVRGNQRRKTFRCDDDYRAYLDRLEKYRAECHVRGEAMGNDKNTVVNAPFVREREGHVAKEHAAKFSSRR